MARLVTLSALQPPYVIPETIPEIRAARMALLREQLALAASRGSQLALVPEKFSTHGLAKKLPLAQSAEPLDGGTVTAARAMAREFATALVLPIDIVDEDGRFWNSAVVIDYEGEVCGVYRKVHLTRAEAAAGRHAGDTYPVFDVATGPGISIRVGVMICHDNSFVECPRCLALAGAELICWPHVQTGWGDIVWDITLRSRAIDNGVWLLSSCFVTQGDNAWRPGMMVGRSGVVGPDGFILAEMARDPGVATAQVDFDAPRLVHSWSRDVDRPFVEELRLDRRPETYALITTHGAPATEANAHANGRQPVHAGS